MSAHLEQAQRRRKHNEYKKQYRAKIRDWLFDQLGRVCKRCGKTEDLQFDIIVPVGEPCGHHGRLSSDARLNFYKREHARQNVQTLCGFCNASKKDRVDLFPPTPPPVPAMMPANPF